MVMPAHFPCEAFLFRQLHARVLGSFLVFHVTAMVLGI